MNIIEEVKSFFKRNPKDPEPTTKEGEAVLTAANLIEHFPEKYNFMESRTPHNINSVGCAIGWVKYFKGENDHDFDSMARNLGFENQSDFYNWMTIVVGKKWRSNNLLAAKGLRLLAKRI